MKTFCDHFHVIQHIMKARKTILKSNLFKILLLVIAISVILLICRTGHWNKQSDQKMFNISNTNNINSVKKRRVINRVLAWMSTTINKRKGGNFWKERKKSSLSKYQSLWVTTEDAVSLTSKYDYKGMDDQISSVLNTDTVGRIETVDHIESESAAIQSELLNTMFKMPPAVSATMTKSQNLAVADLTSGMSSVEVIAKLKSDKYFRQNMQDASGNRISRTAFVPAGN